MEKIDDSICSGIEHADERTWTAFYAAFAPVMRAYAVRRGCDEPGDVVQDVFVKFVKAIRSGCFHGRSVAETCSYLKTQVARRVIDYYRRAKARCCDVTVEFDEFTVPGSYFSHRIVEAMDEASVRSRARAMFKWRCSSRTWAIFEACTSGGRSAVDVAREFSISPGAVRVIRHRVLARLKAEEEKWR